MARLFNILAVRELLRIHVARYSQKKQNSVNIQLCLCNKIFRAYAAWLLCKYVFIYFASLSVVQAAIKRKKTGKYIALKHFDEFYSTVYGNKWKEIKEALLMEEHKYMAVVNSFSDIARIKTELEVCLCCEILQYQHFDCIVIFSRKVPWT